MNEQPLDRPDVTLFFSVASRSFVALWMLEELGIPFEIESVDIRKNEQKEPEYLHVNPMGKVPSITDGPVTVSENPAICIYLADRYGYGGLAPRIDDPERGSYLKWMVFSTAVLEPAMSTRELADELPPHQVGWGRLDRVVDVLSRTLDGRQWLLERGFSGADVMLGGVVSYGLYNELLPEKGPLGIYNERLKARPAYQRAVAATWPKELFPQA